MTKKMRKPTGGIEPTFNLLMQVGDLQEILLNEKMR